MVGQVRVNLTQEEYSALIDLCDLEIRTIPDQVRLLVRRELQRQGLLPPDYRNKCDKEDVQ